ncbi:MAG: L-arabinose isomerase [Spirochaetaceae bacterium]|nr:MAG: L-arabinose isomerase [Spirochaetaceae bacterium]
MIDLKKFEIWFLTGSQHLYGEETLKAVAEHSQKVAAGLDASPHIPVRVVFKPVLTGSDAIRKICLEANADDACVGLVTWMHTFSPAKMWIAGLTALSKPFLHLHTQFNRDIPWASIDMDFMNMNQSAHGGREFGFIATRLRAPRKVVVGHWQNDEVQNRVGAWTRAACALAETKTLKVARIGDNMREVAVTEGDKVAAQTQFGYSVNGYGVGDVVKFIDGASDAEVERIAKQYEDEYTVSRELVKGGERRRSLLDAARIEVGIRAFMEDGGFGAFTTTFENLYGMKQLPGIAPQRLMADGYGFSGEGDWKTAALLRTVKVMSAGLPGGTSFMEDYTYHFEPGREAVLGAHMLEICPTIADGKPAVEVHPLGIGGKEDPVRLVFTGASGPAVNASVIDMGDRFRMLLNTVEAVPPHQELPKLPVARVLWRPDPDLKTAAAAWILAGGAHHTVYTQAVTTEHLTDYAEMAGIELVSIDGSTAIEQFKKELRWNEAYYRLAGGRW